MEHDPDYIHIRCVGRLTPAEEKMLNEFKAGVGHSNSMLGGECTVDILLAVTPIVLHNLAKIIVQLSRDRPRMHIKAEGFEITDADADTAKKIAAQLLKLRNQRPPGV